MKTRNLLFAIGATLALGAGSVAGFLLAQPQTPHVSDLTLANIEALAFIEPDDPDKWDPNNPDPGVALMWCGNTILYTYCVGYCPFCYSEIRSATDHGPFGGFAGGSCGVCGYQLR